MASASGGPLFMASSPAMAVSTDKPGGARRRAPSGAASPGRGRRRTPAAPVEEAAATPVRTLVAYFQDQLAERPHRPALYFRQGGRYRAISWEDMGVAARRISAFLINEGVEPQDHVAIWSNNRPEWHIADIAIMQVRGRPVPVYLTLSGEQGAYVLSHSASKVVFVEDEKILRRVLGVLDQLPEVHRIVTLSERPAIDDERVIDWTEALARGEKALATKTAKELDRRISETAVSDVATLIYTSGTTGPPKAVTLTHHNIGACADALTTFIEGEASDRVLSYLPLAHIAERMVSEFRSYMYGNPTYFLDGIEHLGERLREVRPTLFFGVPRVWEKMAQTVRNTVEDAPLLKRTLAQWALEVGERIYREKAAGRVPSGMLSREHALAERLVYRKLRAALGLDQAKILASGAAPIAPDVLVFFQSIGLEICEVYGQTEDCAVTTMNRPGMSKFGTVGTRLPGIEVRIADDGEILVRGGNVFSGYYKDADGATAETLVDGWLHTGDVGEFDDEGYLRITDRKKDLIITAGGKNIAPSNIEGLLKQHALIANAVAIGDRRPFVSALVTLDPDELQRFAKQRSLEGSVEDLAQRTEVLQEIEAHVTAVNAHLSHVEQVKKWKVLAQDFTVGDELTPSLKVKRKVVGEKYAADIQALYAK